MSEVVGGELSVAEAKTRLAERVVSYFRKHPTFTSDDMAREAMVTKASVRCVCQGVVTSVHHDDTFRIVRYLKVSTQERQELLSLVSVIFPAGK